MPKNVHVPLDALYCKEALWYPQVTSIVKITPSLWHPNSADIAYATCYFHNDFGSFFVGCLPRNTDCCTHVNTRRLDDSLFLERYKTFCGGVFGEMNRSYLTDSSTFRAYLDSDDEHQKLSILYGHGVLTSLRLASNFITDTFESKSLSLDELIREKRFDSSEVLNDPIFGLNDLTCVTFSPFTAYKITDSLFISKDQYHCGNAYINAVYLTESTHFRRLIGLSKPSSGPHYSVEMKGNHQLMLYVKDTRISYDTLQVRKMRLDSLKAFGFEEVCENK